MLQQMRDSFRYLKWILLLIVFMFIWWAFGIWSGGTTGPRQDVPWAARVNGAPIAAAAFQGRARQLDSLYQSILGEQYAQQRTFIRIGQQAINDLVEKELVFQEALRQGITAAPREVAETITRDPGFQEDGRFIGVDRYRDLFKGARITVEQYEEQVRRDLVASKFRSLIEDGVTVSEAEVEQEILNRNEKTAVDYLILDPGRVVGTRPPSEADVARFYEEHRDRYSRGEGRTGIYVFWNARDLAAGLEVAEADLQAAYERDRATRYSQPDQRRASHVLIKVAEDAAPDRVAAAERKARDLLKRARAGADFAELARANSEDGSAAQGGDLGHFGRGQMVREFEEAAFALPVGGLSDVVRSPFGFHIIKVTDSRAARTVPFEEARDALREEIRLERGREEARRRATEFSRAATGGRLADVARSQGLPIQESGSVFDGDALPGLAGSQPAVTRMLALAPGDSSDAIGLASGPVVVQVTGVVPSAPRPLAEVKARVEKDLRDEQARAAVAGAVEAARRSGSGLKGVAARFRAEVKSQADVARGQGLSAAPPDPALRRQIATLAPGAIGDPVVTASGVVVLSVRERRDGRDQLEAQRDQVRDSLLRQRQDRLYRGVVRRLREDSRVEINEALIRSLDRG